MTGQEGHKQHKDWDGNKKNFTTMQSLLQLQCSNKLETEGLRSGRQTLEMRVFNSMSS